MKKRRNFVNRLKLALLSLTALALAACQSTQDEGDAAVMCDKCKSVWIMQSYLLGPYGKATPYIAYRDIKIMQCPDCENAVATFFKTGQLKHRCGHCGGTMSHCVRH